LTFDFPQADDERSFLQAGTNVVGFHRSGMLSRRQSTKEIHLTQYRGWGYRASPQGLSTI
jgi:hypothetical protein